LRKKAAAGSISLTAAAWFKLLSQRTKFFGFARNALGIFFPRHHSFCGQVSLVLEFRFFGYLVFWVFTHPQVTTFGDSFSLVLGLSLLEDDGDIIPNE
jgi:hypothetical protein